VRNLFRNPSRFLVGLIGVVGCATLLLTGFGMRDSVSYVLGHYFGYTMRYDVRVDLKGDIPDGYPEAIASRAGAQRMERVMESSIQLFVGGRWQRKQLTVLEDQHETVYIERGGQRVYLPSEGVTLARRAAEDLGLTVGDTVRLRAENGYETDVKITDIIDIQLGQGVYLSRSAWRKLDIMPYAPTALFLCGGDLDTAAVDDMDGVEKVRTIEEERGGKTSVTGVMDLVVLLLALFAGALLLVVMYTLGELNFFERTRDLATLMVLGFYPRETKRLILRENMIIAILGLPIGLLLGPTLHRWVLAAGLPSILQFVPYISIESWVYTSVLTIAFAWLVNRIIGAKFRKVNMVEALKSVE
jgi:putative ABC transport system permease protein